jgi:hypothetical protein
MSSYFDGLRQALNVVRNHGKLYNYKMNRIYPAEFIIYVYFRTFKTYLWALSLFSLTITIIVSAAAKFLYQNIISYSNYNSFIKGAFQLSYLLFIPIFSVLLIIKYKKKFIEENSYAELNMSNVIAWLFTILLLLAMTFLFTFLLMAW